MQKAVEFCNRDNLGTGNIEAISQYFDGLSGYMPIFGLNGS
jgi:hypothetical protein